MNCENLEKINQIGKKLEEDARFLYNITKKEKDRIERLDLNERASKKSIIWQTSIQYLKQAEIKMGEVRQEIANGIRCYNQAKDTDYNPKYALPIVPYNPNIHPTPVRGDANFNPFGPETLCDIALCEEAGFSVIFTHVKESTIEKWDTIYIFINRQMAASISLHPQKQLWKPSVGLHKFIREEVVRGFPDVSDRNLAKALIIQMLLDPEMRHPDADFYKG